MNQILERLFKLESHQTNPKKELIAGLTTFVTMAYIVLVNPQIMAAAGMDPGASFVGTCIAAALACFAMGLYANWPVGLAPGMGLNAFFTFTVVIEMGYSWEIALGAVFLAGILFFLMSITRLRSWMIESIPLNLRIAMDSGVGLFIGFIGLKNGGIIISNDVTFLKLGDFSNLETLLPALGFLLISVLAVRNVPGAILIGVLTVTVSALLFNVVQFNGLVSMPPSIDPVFLKLDILGAQANSRVFNFSKQLKDQANMYIDQEGNSKIVNDSINTLRGLAQKVNNLVEKKSEWIENNGGDESTKRMFSKGSSGKNKFMQNAIFMEKDDLYKMILPLPEVTVGGDKKFDDIEFAFGDFKAGSKPNSVVKSSDIFKNVFMKPEGKFAQFRKAANKMSDDSKLRKPYNNYHSEVIVNGLLDSKENVLAFAWDDFAGPSFIEQYREANPNEDISFADVDSPNFQENKLKDEVSYWLKRKLKSEHDMARASQEAFAEAGQMTAQQLLKKYSL